MSDLEHQSAALAAKDVEKVYGDGTHALRGFSLHIPAGCFFGLLGPNGSGKSTLIGMISGLVRAPAGCIHVFGCDVVAQAPHARLQVGVAPQDVHLDRFLTTREVLEYHGRYFGMARLEMSGGLAARDVTRHPGRTPRRSQPRPGPRRDRS